MMPEKLLTPATLQLHHYTRVLFPVKRILQKKAQNPDALGFPHARSLVTGHDAFGVVSRSIV
jgi:hypothetical protein